MTDTAHNKLPIWAYIPDDKDGLEIHSAACNPAAWCDLEKCREISATLFTGEQFHLVVDFWNSSYLINNIQVTIFRHVNFVSGQRFKGKYLVRISAIIDEKHKWFNVWFSNAVDAVHTVNVIRKSIYIKGYSPDTFRPRWTGTLQIKVYINSSKRHISEKRYEVFLNKEGLFLFNDWFTEEVAAFSVIHDLNQSVCMSKTEGLNVFEINTTEYVLTVFEKTDQAEFIKEYTSIFTEAGLSAGFPHTTNGWEYPSKKRIALIDRQLQHAVEILSANVDLSQQWAAVESELFLQLDIAEPLEDNAEGVFSSGIDPNSLDKVDQALDQIKSHLVSESYDKALSETRRATAIFKTASNQDVRQLFSESPLDLLKKLFYLLKSKEYCPQQQEVGDADSYFDDLDWAIDLNRDDAGLENTWSAIEHQIRVLIDSSPAADDRQEDVFGAGKDPNNKEHFRIALEQIKGHMVSGRCDNALASLRGTRSIFNKSTCDRINDFTLIGDLDLLKVLFFHAQTEKKREQRLGNKLNMEPLKLGGARGFDGKHAYNVPLSTKATVPPSIFKKTPDSPAVKRLITMINEMDQAVQTLGQNEDFLLPWIVAEEELKALAENKEALDDSNNDFLSGGLDPDDADHMIRALSTVKEDLSDQRYDRALSRWNGIRTIFVHSKINIIRDIVCSYDIDVLKKLYFHSFF